MSRLQNHTIIVHWLALMLLIVLSPEGLHGGVRVGADILVEQRLDLVRGKSIALVMNQTARLSSGEFLVDKLREEGIEVVALLSPEHGVRGEAAAGQSIDDGKDQKTGLPVYSLYGKTRKPTPEMLRNVDVLVYDIQDVGARFYTYISTMGLAMEAAAAMGIPFIVLDRPNPLGGLLVDGPVLEDSLKSFVGAYPVPVVYGLTCGELARMINGELWLASGLRAQLIVVEMEGWRRDMTWEETGLPWIKPSPNIPTPTSALLYPATCFIEATNLSEGRGTDQPFQIIGAPFVNGNQLALEVSKRLSDEIVVEPVDFVPKSSKYKKERCSGIRILPRGQGLKNPVRWGIHLLQQIVRLYPKECRVRDQSLERLIGSKRIVVMIRNLHDPEAIEETWRLQLESYRIMADRYHLY